MSWAYSIHVCVCVCVCVCCVCVCVCVCVSLSLSLSLRVSFPCFLSLLILHGLFLCTFISLVVVYVGFLIIIFVWLSSCSSAIFGGGGGIALFEWHPDGLVKLRVLRV